MRTFYAWGLRNLFLAIALTAAAAGVVGVFEAGLSLSLVALSAFVALTGTWLGRSSKRRADKRDAIANELAAAQAIRERFAGSNKGQRRAA